jgi:hypothetical protein
VRVVVGRHWRFPFRSAGSADDDPFKTRTRNGSTVIAAIMARTMSTRTRRSPDMVIAATLRLRKDWKVGR